MEHSPSPYLIVSTRGRGHKQTTRRLSVGKTRRKFTLANGSRVLPGRDIHLSEEEFEESREVLIPGDQSGTLEVKKWVAEVEDYVDVDFDEDGKAVVQLKAYKKIKDELKARVQAGVRQKAKNALLGAKRAVGQAEASQAVAEQLMDQAAEMGVDTDELIEEIELEANPPAPEPEEETEGEPGEGGSEGGDDADGDAEGEGSSEAGDGDDADDPEADDSDDADGEGDDSDGDDAGGEGDDAGDGDPEPPADYSKLTKRELLAECVAQDLEHSDSMNKAELVAKLQG